MTAAFLKSHVSPVETREELLYLLSRASELEHNLACVYLYAGYSLKTDASEGGVTAKELEHVRRWKRRLATVAVEEMLHLAQVSNILTAVGGAPNFARSNFPMPSTTYPFGIEISLEPFSQALIERLVCYEMPEDGVLPNDRVQFYDALRQRVAKASPGEQIDAIHARNDTEPFDIDFRTVGEFYHKIESAFDCIPESRLFIGPPQAQANAKYLDVNNQLVSVVDAASAKRGIDMIVEQGEAPSREHPSAHFVVFDSIRREFEQLTAAARARGEVFQPVRPMISNPTTRGYGDAAGALRITGAEAQTLADLFNTAYDTMLTMLLRFFAHEGETEEELRMLARGTLRLMASGLRPLGDALAKTPAGPEYPGMTAGPPFGINRSVHLLAHKQSAWIFFLERLCELSQRMTQVAAQPGMPAEVQEAAAVFESVAEHLSPYIPGTFVQEITDHAKDVHTRPSIHPEPNGPYIVRNLTKLTNSKGETLNTRPILALCRCGGSNLKPYCDGTHARIGFSSAKSPQRTPDRLDAYANDGFTVFDNRGTCCHFGNCSDHLPQVFHASGEPFVTVEGASPETTEAIVRQCPSGALGFMRDGDRYEGEDREPEIYVAANASYYVTGGIELEGTPMNQGASREHYALCRCGHSKNKPFCDGTHWWIKFEDPNN